MKQVSVSLAQSKQFLSPHGRVIVLLWNRFLVWMCAVCSVSAFSLPWLFDLVCDLVIIVGSCVIHLSLLLTSLLASDGFFL